MNKKSPHDVDIVVGRNVRLLRNQRGISQAELAEAVSITFQQVQKYEKGTNRISASRLHEIATFFSVSVATLFHGSSQDDDGENLLPFSAEALSVAGDFDRINNPKIRQKTKSLIAALADASTDAASG